MEHDNVFVVVMMLMVALCGFALGFVTGSILTERGYVKSNNHYYNTIEELIEDNP